MCRPYGGCSGDPQANRHVHLYGNTMRKLFLIFFLVFLHDAAFAYERFSYSVTCDNHQAKLDFLIKDNIVLVDAVAFSDAMKVPCSFDKKLALFQLMPEKSNRKYRFSKERKVRFIYHPQDTTLEMPTAPVLVDGRIFIPFDFLTRILNTNYRFSANGFHIGPSTPIAADAIDILLEKKYLFNLYDVYNIDGFYKDFYMRSNGFIMAINSLMSGEIKKLLYLGDYFLQDKHIATSDIVNDIIKKMILTQSFELQQDKEKNNAYIKDMMFFAEELTDGWQLKNILEGIQKQKLKESIADLDGILKKHISLHGESTPPAVTKLTKRIDRLAKSSSFIDAVAKGPGLLLGISFHQLEVLDDFTHRSEKVLKALRILTDNISSIKQHVLPDATYDRIRREHESYKSLHDRIIDDLTSTQAIDILLDTFDPYRALTSTAWHLASELLISDTLEDAENYVLASYAMPLVIDIGMLAKKIRSKTFTARSIDDEKYNELISIAYLFGKASYMTRKMGLNCGLTPSDPVKKEQLQLNEEIEAFLALIDTDNKGYLVDKFDYLKDYDDTRLINFLRSSRPVQNPLLGKWHAEMHGLGTKAVFPVVFNKKNMLLYGENDRPKIGSVLYAGDKGKWSISEDGGVNWEKVHFKNKDNFVMFSRGLSISYTRADYSLPEDRNPLLGEWHGKAHILGSTGIFPMLFTEKTMRLHHPGGSSRGPVIYKRKNDILFFSIDNGKHWNTVSFKDEDNCIIMMAGFSYVCTRVK